MKNQRPGLGIVLVATSIAVVVAPHCGVLGHAISRTLHTLIGSAGIALTATTLFLFGTVCLVPAGAVSTVIRELRKSAAAARPHTCTACHDRKRQLPAAPARVLPLRPENDEVRSGLKHLGYTREEIDSALARMDRSRSTEQQLRDALKLLRRAS